MMSFEEKMKKELKKILKKKDYKFMFQKEKIKQ